MYSNNFGVIELASTKTTSAPGWAYIPDTGVNPAAALQPSNRKRARNQGPNLSGADLSARQEAKIRKELETLDRDSNRDIPVPQKTGSGRAASKSTPAIRKILQSQKTFANHLDDYGALLAQTDHSPAPHPNQYFQKPPHPNQHTKRQAQATQPTKRPPQPNQHTKRNATSESASASSKKAESSSRSRGRRSIKAEPEPEPEPESQTGGDADVDMLDAPDDEKEDSGPSILTPYEKPPPPAHPGDADPLLVSVIPDLPSNEELRRLLEHPPLAYGQAKASWGPNDKRYPERKFCDVCGYWGRVKCMKCGTRVCALECLEVHREGCLQRYGL